MILKTVLNFVFGLLTLAPVLLVGCGSHSTPERIGNTDVFVDADPDPRFPSGFQFKPVLNGSYEYALEDGSGAKIKLYPDYLDCSRWYYDITELVPSTGSEARESEHMNYFGHKSGEYCFAPSIYDFTVAPQPILNPQALQDQIRNHIRKKQLENDPDLKNCKVQESYQVSELPSTYGQIQLNSRFKDRGADITNDSLNLGGLYQAHPMYLRLTVDLANPHAEPTTAKELQSGPSANGGPIAMIENKIDLVHRLERAQLQVSESVAVAKARDWVSKLKCTYRPIDNSPYEPLARYLLGNGGITCDQAPSLEILQLLKGCELGVDECASQFQYKALTAIPTASWSVYRTHLLAKWLKANFNVSNLPAATIEPLPQKARIQIFKTVSPFIQNDIVNWIPIQVPKFPETEFDMSILDRPQMSQQRNRYDERRSQYLRTTGLDEQSWSIPIPINAPGCKEF